MKHILFIFVDGIGLGDDNPEINPFVVANLPTLTALSNGKKWISGIGRQVSERAIFIPTDPRLGVAGRPQSGSSQAAILTGKNVPQLIGRHYGPKPDEATRNLLTEDNFFIRVRQRGKTAALLDGYPQDLLDDFERGHTLPSSIQYAAIQAGQKLFTKEDVIAGRSLTAEYTGKAWREYLKLEDTPIYSPQAAGHKLVELSRNYDFAFHSHWMTDYVGHRGPFERGVELLEILDGVMQGILETWDDNEGLVILTSDHGNMEHIGDRKHTENDVPTLIIGDGKETFAYGLSQLTDFVPRMEKYLLG
jgi:2,3-bisphosphoglycerate-independent phosphoglycerate mutase